MERNEMDNGSRVDWIIFYGDGSTFSSDDGKPCDAPPLNVQVLIQENANGKWVFYTKDNYYVWGWRSKNEWVAVDQAGREDYDFHHTGCKNVLFGRWIDDISYEKIYKKADEYWRTMA